MIDRDRFPVDEWKLVERIYSDERMGLTETIFTALFPRAPEGSTPDAVAVAPGGSQPSYSLGVTTRDNDFYREWDKLSRDRDAFQSWMREHVLEPTKAAR